ncbi:hypothetical protein CQW23_31694 [Capsicum baccatum]|uniref:Protein TAR1 n=1 Tax=Capsicum baccatum TaxID=33114 RepID=A0A2G2V6V8_CAPBA|nr:hypothetical protein CQW23_31694 [Capsicum baccatum]
MIGKADIEGSKSNVAMNAWLPQASYPCVGFPLSTPVLSWLFDARGRSPKEPFPVRPPAGTRQPALTVGELEQSTDSRRVRNWDPRAQPSEPIFFPKLRIHFVDFHDHRPTVLIDQHPLWDLALDEIHRPIYAAIPNNPNRRQRLVVRHGPGTTRISPSPALPSRGLGPGPLLRTLLQTTIRTTEPSDSKVGLFPVTRRYEGNPYEAQVPQTHAADGAREAGYQFKYSLALSAPGFVGCPPRTPVTGIGARAKCRSTPPARTPQLLNTFVGSFCCAGFDNDPSAGSPTETLLRLLLPLNDKVQWTSRDVAGSEPPTSPNTGPNARQ